MPLGRIRFAFSILVLSAVLAPAAMATWSVVAVDEETQEVGVASATCVPGIDLESLSPTVVVGLGGGAAQFFVDSTGARRLILRDGLLAGLDSDEIMARLIALPNSEFHQNGHARTAGDAATFSGAGSLAHASGVSGQSGTIHYAIQGNLLTGMPVVTMALQALTSTAGALPEKLMAAMESARAMGGDGRCSCPGADPEGCGSPPASFEKSAHVGFLLVARYGDGDDPACNASGCADGDYLLDLNVAFQNSGDQDPVLQLRTLFDAWRRSLEDRPDAVESQVTFSASGSLVELHLELFDWRGQALGASVAGGITVIHHPDSAQGHDIGPVIDHGGGTYSVTLTPNGGTGDDLFEIIIDDGIRPVVFPPLRTRLPGQLLFADGFESGTTESWSGLI